jgi:hypothetical protein
MMMASDNKKAKADPAPKSETAAKDKSTSGEAVPKTEGGEATATATAPSNYSRGEGQKPVSAAYKENWNTIFAKKTRRKQSDNVRDEGCPRCPRELPRESLIGAAAKGQHSLIR